MELIWAMTVLKVKAKNTVNGSAPSQIRNHSGRWSRSLHNQTAIRSQSLSVGIRVHKIKQIDHRTNLTTGKVKINFIYLLNKVEYLHAIIKIIATECYLFSFVEIIIHAIYRGTK